MMSLIPGAEGVQRGLIDLYKAPSNQALMAVTFALHEVPKQGSRSGPAFRSAPVRLSNTATRYGTVLKDIRDFLKLRFRVKGEFGVQPAPSAAIGDAFRNGDRNGIEAALGALSADELPMAFHYLVHPLITELDALSRFDSMMQDEELVLIKAQVLRLRDLLRAVLGWLDPDHYYKYTDQAFAESGI